MWRKFFNWINFFGMLTVFFSIWIFAQITTKAEILEPIEEALVDYNVTDIVFSKLRTDQTPDTNIVLVNIGDAYYEDIAKQVNILNKYSPKVIGIHHVLDQDQVHEIDSLLSLAFQNTKSLVLMSYPYSKKDAKQNHYDSIRLPLQIFRTGTTGFGKLVNGNEQFDTWRNIEKNKEIKGYGAELPFAYQVAKFFDSKVAQSFLDHSESYEIINYRGNIDKFTVLDIEDVLNENFVPEMIQGKIVLLGYLGSEYTSTFWDGHKFYTPLNENQIGRGTPDMYGVVVQANIVSMILEANYVHEIPNWVSVLVAVLVAYLNVAFFIYITTSKYGLWYDIITKIFQLIEVIALVGIIVLLFVQYNQKLDLTLALLAIILAGDVVSIYLGVIVNAYERFRLFLMRNRHFFNKS